MELVVSIVLITVVGYLSSEILISSFRSERQLRDKTLLTDQADYLKTWLDSHLQQADSPLPCPAGTGTGCTELPSGAPGNTFHSLEFISNNYCYLITLDQSVGVIYAGQSTQTVSSGGVSAACGQAQTEALTTKDNVVAQYVTNDSNNKLFTFKSSTGSVLAVDSDPTQISNATAVEVTPIFNRPNSLASSYSRDITYNLGGAFVPDSPADGSITSNKIASSAVTGSKIADGSITSSKLQSGAITADKLDSGSKTAYLDIPLIDSNTSQWTLPDTTNFYPTSSTTPDGNSTPSAVFRAGAKMGDYCVANKTLQGRLLLTINSGGSSLTLTPQITQYDASSNSQTNGPFPYTGSPASIAAGQIGLISTGWFTVDTGTCTASWLNNTYFYMPQVEASAGSSGQPFTLVSAVLELRYQ